MKRLSIFACIICMLALASCNFFNKPQMEVYYLEPLSERSCAIEPDTLLSFLNKDSIVDKEIPKEDWNYINSHIKKTNKQKNVVCEPEMVIKKDSLIFFINDLGAFDRNYDSIDISPKAIYLIQRYSSYYNKVSRDDLQYFDLIKKYGIPKDHFCEYDRMSSNELFYWHRKSTTYHLQPED